ncbi:MAG: regulatory YrvL family protein [Lachnospiraceae bacterium]|nr:regulatory YrvL family protein [Lachnospiraceae bacterium]MDD7178589.1 YrvL family regulatory protein [bacterium]MDY5516688.1 YrvL family regulatory protein [Lachnospiraceae bacterium]
MHVNKRILKDVLDSLSVFLVAFFLFIGVIALLCVFGGEVMRVFGFRYSSVRSVMGFFIFGAIISWPISLAAEAIPKVLCFDKKVLKKWQAVIVYIALATFATSVGLFVVDSYTTKVVANRPSIIVVSLLLALCNSYSIIVSRPENT